MEVDKRERLIYPLQMGKELLIPWLQPSSLGDMLLVVRESGALILLSWSAPEAELVRCAKLAKAELAPLRRLTQRADGTLDLASAELPASVSAAARGVDDYLHGRTSHPAVAVDYLLVRSDFQRQVLIALCQVQPRQTTTYGALARQLLRPAGAARAVGQAVGRNPIAIAVPCHRVVASDGSLGGFSGELWRKRRLLELEGVAVPGGGWEVKRSAAPSPAIA